MDWGSYGGEVCLLLQFLIVKVFEGVTSRVRVVQQMVHELVIGSWGIRERTRNTAYVSLQILRLIFMKKSTQKASPLSIKYRKHASRE
jgi:hypothetical protein